MKLPKAEGLIFFAFLVCTALWAISKCNDHRAEATRRARSMEESESDERQPRRDTVPASPKDIVQAPTTTVPPEQAPPTQPAPTSTLTKPTTPGVAPRKPSDLPPPEAKPEGGGASTSGTTLYVSIEGLKVRKEPGLKGETVAELKLYEPVTFLNQKTDWTQEISLGYEKVTDHWIKIRTQSGKSGWVFGAGVHYYKMKRKGVLETAKPEPVKKKNR